uniref:Uncharacterized protein n=1 Tax=Arundo donax TaxID=35708 RepID=A0A0A9H8N3_ARUDO
MNAVAYLAGQGPRPIFCACPHYMAFAPGKLQILSIVIQIEELHKLGQPFSFEHEIH